MAVQDEASSSTTNTSSEIHYLAKYALRSSAVLQVVHGHLRSRSSNDIVFGKETSIELVMIDENGIVLSIYEQPVFGTIKDLAILPWNEKFHAQSLQMLGKDVLIVLSDSGKLSFLSFSNENHRFFPLTHIEFSPPGNSRYEIGRMLAVDTNGCFIAASAYEDWVALFSVAMSAGNSIIDKRRSFQFENMDDLSKVRGICTIWSMCFISNDFFLSSELQKPVLAILLNRRGSYQNDLLLLQWNTVDNTVSIISHYTQPLAHSIVEVPQSCGFAVLFRFGDILLLNLKDAQNPHHVFQMRIPTTVEEPVEESFVETHDGPEEVLSDAATALLQLGESANKDTVAIAGDGVKPNSRYICSCSWEPGNGKSPRMMFCLDSGEVFMISFDSDDAFKFDVSECLYKGLPCKALLWIEGAFLLAIIEMGDSMVLKLEDGRLVYRSSIQNIAPIVDILVSDHQDERLNQMFACCGVAPEGSLRIIHSGISVEKLVRTAPIHQGMTGTWAVKMRVLDSYHSFVLLSYFDQTRVLRVGESFTDVTDTVGFKPDVCTLACGLVHDGSLVQIYSDAVRLCLPTRTAHPHGVPLSSPVCTSWFPSNIKINVGAVGHNLIVIATSIPCFLYILGVQVQSTYQCEIYEMHHVPLQNELSCVSIPRKPFEQKPSTSLVDLVDNSHLAALGIEIGNCFIIGTRKPSLEVVSFVPDEGVRVLAVGTILLTEPTDIDTKDYVPQDVRLVLFDRFYVLSGLRNGMLLRFEWPSLESPSQMPRSSSCSVNPDTSPSKTSGPKKGLCSVFEKGKDGHVHLQLIATRQIGNSPAQLIPLGDSLDADIIILSARPWLLRAARHSLSYSSISFQPSTHVTPVCSVDCPKGILFASENRLHLVEMLHHKKLNSEKFHLGGTPRKVLYHRKSGTLLVMRTDLSNDSYSSDICCVSPVSGSVLSSFKLDLGETGKSMELVRVGDEQVLVVGTSLSADPVITPSGVPERPASGNIIVLRLKRIRNSDDSSMKSSLSRESSSRRTSPSREIDGVRGEHEETEAWQLRTASCDEMPGVVLSICSYLDRYFLASAGETFYVCGFEYDNPREVRSLATARTLATITTMTSHFTTIVVSTCHDAVLFYTYHEDSRTLRRLDCNPLYRLVADCVLIDVGTAVISDRQGYISVISSSGPPEEHESPERNLTISCSYNMTEIARCIRKGSFSYLRRADDIPEGFDGAADTTLDLSHRSITASTLLGSVLVLLPLSSADYGILKPVQAKLARYPLTAPVLGNDPHEFRSRGTPTASETMLEGDMLLQFLELTTKQQETVLQLTLGAEQSTNLINMIVKILEQIHYTLN